VLVTLRIQMVTFRYAMHNRQKGRTVTITMPAQEPAILTIDEAARYLRLSRPKVYNLVAAGDLPAVRVGRSVRIRRDRLEAWIEEHSR
jgi:excisionase family DNA binding protein